jgi:hypothetical protein
LRARNGGWTGLVAVFPLVRGGRRHSLLPERYSTVLPFAAREFLRTFVGGARTRIAALPKLPPPLPRLHLPPTAAVPHAPLDDQPCRCLCATFRLRQRCLLYAGRLSGRRLGTDNRTFMVTMGRCGVDGTFRWHMVDVCWWLCSGGSFLPSSLRRCGRQDGKDGGF